eukprot:scaffold36165_cov183-Amphora_coffeaeformis.AAC.2
MQEHYYMKNIVHVRSLRMAKAFKRQGRLFQDFSIQVSPIAVVLRSRRNDHDAHTSTSKKNFSLRATREYSEIAATRRMLPC